MRQKRTMNRQGLFIAVALLTLFVTACYIPLTEVLIKSVTDEIPPEILISEPSDNSNYSSTVIVRGTVTDVTATDGTLGEVRILSWSVSPAFLTGAEVEVAADGSFTFDFLTAGFSGSVILTLQATDANDNVYESSVTLNKASSDIPTFTAVAGNQEVLLSWDPVPMAESYTLFYTTDGGQPSEFYGSTIEDVSSPYTLADLGNGSRHVFLLRAVSAGSAEDYSDYVESIPLSPATLQPTLQEAAGSVAVVWPEIAGTDSFTVLRATDPAGPFVNISGATSKTPFVDRGVIADAEYWYQVHPALSADVVSNTTSIWTTPFINVFSSTTLTMPDYTDGVAIDGNYAYLALGGVGLRVVDISDPSALRIVGSLDISGNATDIAVSGNYAYMVDYNASVVRVIDISAPAAPALVTNVATSGNGRAVRISGNYVYVATTAGLDVIDISSPQSAALVPDAPFVVAGVAYTFEISGTTGYIGTATGITVVDINDPPNTVATGDTVNLSATVFDLEISGEYAYVVDITGFRILDITNIASPVELKYFPGSGLQDVELIGEFAFVSGLNVLEIYNAQAPLVVDSPYLAKTIRTPAWGLRSAAAGSHVAFGTSSGFSMIDVSVFAATVTDAPIGGIGANEYLVEVDDGVAYLTDDTGLAAYDTTGATSFSLIGEVMADGLVYGMEVSGDVVYVGTVPSPNLWIFRYAAGTGYTRIATVDTGEWVGGVVVHGDHAFVPVASGVKIVDITDPDNAAITNELTVAPVYDMVAVEDRSYTVVSGTGLLIHDITDPESPELLYTLFHPEDSGVAVSGDYAVIWDSAGARLINIARPAEDLNYAVTVTGMLWEMTFVGDLIFASTNAGLEIVDYSDLSNISVIRTVTDADGIYQVFPTGRFLYAMAGFTGPEQRVLTWTVP